MAGKTTPINQQIVFELVTKSQNVEAALKSVLDKFKNSNLSDAFSKSFITSLQKVLDKTREMQKIISETGDVNTKTVSEWTRAYEKLSNDIVSSISKIENSSIDFKDTINYDKKEFDRLKDELKRVQDAQKEVYNPKGARIQKLNTPKAVPAKLNKEIVSNLDNIDKVNALLDVQNDRIQQSANNQSLVTAAIEKQITNYEKVKLLLAEIEASSTKVTNDQKTKAEKAGVDLTGLNKADSIKELKKVIETTNIDELNTDLAKSETQFKSFEEQLKDIVKYRAELNQMAGELAKDFTIITESVTKAKDSLDTFKQQAVKNADQGLSEIAKDAANVKAGLDGAVKSTEDMAEGLVQAEQRQNFFSDIRSKITQLFGLASAFQLVRRFVNEAWTAIKELDAAFTEIAVVTQYSTTDLWKSFDMYNKMAQQLGVTTVDAIETSALYYQQGLETKDVMVLTTETIKMARIANMDYAEATKAMTAAIRGFKMEMADAQTIVDVYSALAAEAAVDTQDLATAISKTASIAGSAGLSFESTSAFLTQIIETTQEAAETAGTALKTIIARFTELKKDPLTLSVEVEGEMVDANKIETALHLADVDLRDSNQQFRDLDTVFLELSKTWNTLDRNTQRYIATVAAGSRQQSRFIAMMDNYERTVELVGIANNSANASEIQFAKTLDSVAAKVNKLQTSFQELMGKLIENKAVKGFLEFLNNILQTLNSVADQGIVAFTTFLVTIGIIVKNALMAFIGLFQTVSKQWEQTKLKIKEDIVVNLRLNTVLAETQYNKLRTMMGLPVVVPITPAPLPGSKDFIGPMPAGTPNVATNKDNKTIANIITGPVGSSIGQGLKNAIVPSLISIFASGSLKGALIPVIGSLITSVLSNQVITDVIGKYLVAAFSNPFLLVGAAAVALGYGLWKWLDPLEAAKRKVKAAREEFEKMQEAAEESRAAFLTEQDKFKTLTEQKTRYKELEDAISLTAEEQKELNDLSNNLAEQFPELVSYYDQAGNAVLKQSEAWNDILETQRQITIETQKQYGTDLIASAQSEEKLRLAEIKKTEEEISKVRIKSYWFGITNDRLKELDKLNGKLTDLQAQGQKTQATLSGAIKIISQSSLSLKSIIEDVDLSSATQEIGQKIISSETQEFNDFVERYKNASEKEREDLISAINPLLKNYFQNNEEDILSGDLDFVSDAADIITNNLFDELSQIDGDKISQALSDVANTTQEEFRNTVTSIIGKDNPLVEQIVALFSEADEQYQKSLRAFAKEDALESLISEGNQPKWNEIYDEWIKGGEGAVRAFLEKANFSPEQTNKILIQLQNALSESDAYRIGEKWGKDILAGLVAKYGEDAPNIANFIEGTNTTVEQQKILATGDYSSVEGIMDIYSALSDTTSIEQAQSLIIQVMTQIDDAVDKTAVTFKSSTVNIASALTNSGKRVQKYSKVFSDMAKNINELTESELNDLMEDLPGSAELFKQVADGTMEWKVAVQGLKDIAFANDLYEVQKAIVGVQDALVDSGEGSYEAAVALDELGMSQSDWTANQDIIQAVLAGDSEAIWGYIDSVWGAAMATQTLDGMSLNGMSQQIAGLVNVSSSQIQALTTDMIDYARVLESLGMGTVKTVTVDVPPSADDWLMGYRDTQKKTLTYFEYIPTKGKPFTSTYTAPKPKKTGSEKEYTTKVDKYYNEIQAIQLLQDKLESLSDARERGDLTPEQYRENISATDKYYAELQNKLHQYNEMLRADQKALAKEINSSGYGSALKVVNGQLLVNKAAIEGTSDATQEAIDDQIDAYEALTEAIKTNSEEWWKAQEEQVKILEESRDNYLSLEERIINILIEQDKKEIEATQKKYEVLKKADQDYLDALRKNISDRRKARDKEESYSDLAKKEKRLALLKRDTSGMYASDIIALEEELRQMRQDISDQETDDMVAKLEEEASARATNYDTEIEELNNLQEDKEESMEYYNNRANIIMANGYNDMINWLKKYDSEYLKSSETAQQKFIESWKKTIMEASALYDLTTFSMTPEERKTTAHSDADEARATLQEAGYTKGASDISSHGAEGALDWYIQYIQKRQDLTEEVKLAFWEIVKAKYRYDGKTIPPFPGYSEGGLVNYTGIAMVHGSKTNPESFLDAEDTRNFLTLSQLLSKALTFNGNTDAAQDANGTTIMGDCNITVEVGSIANDYDVERMIDVIKQRILESSGYRNINLIKQVR